MGSIGELAALATAFCWTGSAVSFEAASNRVGSVPVNLLRLLVAFALLAAWGAIGHGRLLPLEAPVEAWGWLGVSGLVGFTLGDLFLFRSFVVVGARVSMLVMCLAPPATAVMGAVFLHEDLGLVQILGMAMTVGGVAWTVLEGRADDGGERPSKASTAQAGAQASAQAGTQSPAPAFSTASAPTSSPTAPALPAPAHARTRAWGVVLAALGALGQASGLILSKQGMTTFEDPFGASQIRVLAGIVGFAVAFTFAGAWPRVAAATKDPRAMTLLAVGAVFGPFLGVSLSLLAVHATEAGVASAIMSIVPVLMLPIAHLRGEPVSRRAVAGTLLAVAGVVVLFNG